MLAGRHEEGLRAWGDAFGSEAFGPETAHGTPARLYLKLTEDQDARNRWHRGERSLRMMVLPLSYEAWIGDLARMRARHMSPRFPFNIPEHGRFRSEGLQVAEELGRMGLHVDAAVAFREHVYYSMDRSRAGSHRAGGDGTWLHHGAARIWLEVAEQEWRAGRPGEAADQLAKAWVFGDAAAHAEARARAARWREAGAPPPAKATPDPQGLLKVVGLYREMRLHPRALRLLAEHGDVLEPPERADRVAEVREEWLKHMERYCRIGRDGPCILWGQVVETEEARLAVVAPPPASPEARAQAAAWVREILEYLDGTGEPPGEADGAP